MKTTLAILIAAATFAQAEPLDAFHQVVANSAAANPLAYVGTDYGRYGNGRYDPARQSEPSINERQEAEKMAEELRALKKKIKDQEDRLRMHELYGR